MTLITRRHVLQGGAGLGALGFGTGAYAGAIEPGFRLVTTEYRVTPAAWPAGLSLKVAVIADIHACEPWMPPARIRHIAEVANGFAPDVTVLLGDFNGGHRYVTGAVYPEQWAEALSVLRAPLGIYGILGNHDWWHGVLPGVKSDEGEGVRAGLRQAGAILLENHVWAIWKDGQKVWLAGLGDQIAITVGKHHHRGVDDLSGTLAQVTDDAPVILLAHEPFVFSRVPDRVALTLCGHTHGGQVNLPVLSTIYAEERYGMARIYGQIVDGRRQMIISGGLGTSFVPVRFLRPPEVVFVTIGGDAGLPAV